MQGSVVEMDGSPMSVPALVPGFSVQWKAATYTTEKDWPEGTTDVLVSIKEDRNAQERACSQPFVLIMYCIGVNAMHCTVNSYYFKLRRTSIKMRVIWSLNDAYTFETCKTSRE